MVGAEKDSMKNGYLVSFSAMLAVSGGLMMHSASSESEWVPDLSSWMKTDEPVLVVLVGSDEGVRAVRAAVSSDRVVAETETAFAMIEGRVIASNAEAASQPINQAGWVDREIQMLAIPMSLSHGPKGPPGQGERGGGSDEDRAKAQKIAELMKKPTINALEASVLMQHMDQTGQF